MALVMYLYPKCGTCRKAKKYLEEHGVSFTEKNIVEESPSREQLAEMVAKSGLPVQKFFNTSGMKYRELGLSKKLKGMSDDEKLDLLASDGMLIKRPITTDGEKVTVGFREETFADTWVK
ncbi:arsenate reductase family protein [Paenactinomyces guangxiensis]|uniref:Arsenate reductase family protein n=1 Tax=Paenactinomyces guangxiensis TaxID=1490290 RepID=A0A7W2A7S1_9BACL|nr:arsenate reductase family protein [Paenactinomyces guangxiensis]MBA4494821.1 arsenate reductase family protein [Paenactinomyces guangxiensis]MBH8591904.1 arsenate reductase family protein [Paenactinomyces guangxiensis]